MRLYVDTNVFMDYITERMPCNFFERALRFGWTIVFSTITLREIEALHQRHAFVSLLQFFSSELIIHTKSDCNAALIYMTHYADALHIVLAQRSGCDAIITRNKRDFFESIIPVRGPNEKL